MLRLQEHINVWRGALLALLFVALLGPWWFDRIVVPAQYACTTAVRLEGDFCGIPMAGIWTLLWIVAVPANMLAGLTSGNTTVADFLKGVPISLVLCSLVLPFISTVILILRGEGPRRRVFQIIACGLAAGAGLFFGLSSHPALFWVLWGVWLYTGLAVMALILELLAASKGRRSVADPGPIPLPGSPADSAQ